MYASYPAAGAPVGAEMRAGMQLALDQAQGRAGSWRISVRASDDATAGSVASDPAAILDIGQVGAQASHLLAVAGIAHLSLVRLEASEAVEADAELLYLHDSGCSRVGIVAGPQAGSYPTLLAAAARATGGAVVLNASARLLPASLGPQLKKAAPGCVTLAASTAPATAPAASAAELAELIHATLPQDEIMGVPALCTPAFTDAAGGGVSTDVDRSLRCTQPTIPVAHYPGGRSFRTAYERVFRTAPSTAAVLGDAAMTLALDAIGAAGANGDNRAAVHAELFEPRPHSTVLGQIAFAASGKAVPALVGVYGVDARGLPVYRRTVRPAAGGG